MKSLPYVSSIVPTQDLLKVIMTYILISVLSLAYSPTQACNNTSLTLDSVVVEGSNYRTYVTLCIGGGITGASRGADDMTLDMAFGFYTSGSSINILNFTPSSVVGDSSGGVMPGTVLGFSALGADDLVYYAYPGSGPAFMCVSSVNQCGQLHSQCDQYSFLTNVIPDSIRLFGAEGAGNPYGGCFPNSDMVVFPPMMPFVADAGPDTLICRGDSVTLGGNPTYNGGGSNYLYTWAPTTGLNDHTVSNPLAQPQQTTTYSVTVRTSMGTYLASDTVTVSVDSLCVWPGDCNFDYIANYLDILNIGLAYNYIGPIRPVLGNGWFGHAAWDWSGSFLSGVNHKHADSNGDGLVNFQDALAIFTNYGQTHSGNRTQHSSHNDLYFYTLQDSVLAGDTLWIHVGYGTDSCLIDSAYGVGFQLFYPPSLVDSGSVVVRYDSSWLGTDQLDMITLDMDLYQSGVVEVGMTRIDHFDTTGYGELCRIGLAMQDDISAKVEAIASATAVLRLDGGTKSSADGTLRALSGSTDSVLVYDGLLPVIWSDFNGRMVDEGIQLNWATVTEVNSDLFRIERAIPGGSFESIGTLPAAGNSSQGEQYQFLDPNPAVGENLYRLVQKDLDGSQTKSAVISVSFLRSGEISLDGAPKLFEDRLQLKLYSAKEQSANLQLVDLAGHQIINQQIVLSQGMQTISRDFQSLSTGVYLLSINTASSKVKDKLVLF